MADPHPLLRRARPDEAARITAMVMRSKSSWGYSESFMELVAPDMTITPADIVADQVEVLDVDGAIVGMLRLQRHDDHAWLQDLFVDPSVMGRGLGRRLFQHAASCAREWGYRELRFESDPNAESFYLRLGAERIGAAPSSLVPGRELPQMRYQLERQRNASRRSQG
jgi:GNAT superfamily N-acetyltransferase